MAYEDSWILKVQRTICTKETTYYCRVEQGLDRWLAAPIMGVQECTVVSPDGQILGEVVIRYSRRRLNPNVFPDYPWDAARFIVLERSSGTTPIQVNSLVIPSKEGEPLS